MSTRCAVLRRVSCEGTFHQLHECPYMCSRNILVSLMRNSPPLTPLTTLSNSHPLKPLTEWVTWLYNTYMISQPPSFFFCFFRSLSASAHASCCCFSIRAFCLRRCISREIASSSICNRRASCSLPKESQDQHKYMVRIENALRGS